MARILVTGASGFIGRRLVPHLVAAGHDVRAMTRDPENYVGEGYPVFGDVHQPDTLTPALDGVEVAYYLVHSLDDVDFERKDADAARAFGAAAAAAGVRQIVYLGGLGADDDTLSAHLRSRRDVESLLGEDGVPVTVLRAAIVVGAGGISWEITKQLVEKLPAMVVPKWAETRTQPIALSDVITYLAAMTDNPDALGRIFDIGGADVLTYLEMMQQAAEVLRGHRLPIVTVPVLTPGLSSHWISFITDVDTTTAANLIDSMSTEVVVTNDAISQVVDHTPLTYRDAVTAAYAETL